MTPVDLASARESTAARAAVGTRSPVVDQLMRAVSDTDDGFAEGSAPMRIAMIGTRGCPAAYGGFETAVEEVGRRLVARGHQVTVYCRGVAKEEQQSEFLGMELIHLPAVRKKSLETLSHTALSTIHMLRRGKHDVAIVFNAANAPFLPLIRAAGIPVATHVDGLEWKRAKWGPMGRRYYRAAEALAVRWSDTLIADARGISDYYTERFGVDTDLITYGAPILLDLPSDKLAALNVTPGDYHLVVARFEPENHVHLAVEGYLRSQATKPLIVVGSAPYANDYTASIEALAASDPRVRLVGGVWDQKQLDQLYAHASTYIHGHSVGGTNPSLLRAMGAGSSVLAYDVNFNREVLGETGQFFQGVGDLAVAIDMAEHDAAGTKARGQASQIRAAERYRWEDVADGYAAMCQRLVDASQARVAKPARRSMVASA
jgi:glycosyltransferase involved in cell wall biosynthesis